MKNVSQIEERVLYADTDHGGVVYYASYLRWFERGRAELFRSLGLTYAEFEKNGIISPVVELKCRYHHPARYDDILVLTTWVERLGPASITFSYQMHKKPDQLLIVTAETINAFINRESKCIRMPKEIREALKNKVL